MDIAARLAELKSEKQKGQQLIGELERRLQEASAGLLRIDGAIKILEELTETQEDSENDS